MPEHVRPAILEIADQQVRRFVDDVKGSEEGEWDEEGEEHGESAGAASAAAEAGGVAEEVGEGRHGGLGELRAIVCMPTFVNKQNVKPHQGNAVENGPPSSGAMKIT